MKIDSAFNITGRGIALVTDLDFDAHYKEFKPGQIVTYNESDYKIISVEAALAFQDGNAKEYVAFIVTGPPLPPRDHSSCSRT